MLIRKHFIYNLRLGVLILALLGLLAGCGGAPITPQPTATPQPAAPQPTAPQPTAPQPTTPQPTAPQPTAPQPTTAPPQATSYIVYEPSDGSLQRSDGPGAPPITLADPIDSQARQPWAATPDGQTIAIVVGRGLWRQPAPPVSLALWLVGADGSNPRKVQDLLPARGVDLTPGGGDAFNLVPALTSQQRLAWSPDGQLVAFVSAHEDQVDLYTAALNGAITRLTNTPALEQGPSWSPDGALVAYRTTSGFGTGAGWGDVGLAATPRGGGPPAWALGDRQLANGRAAAAIPDLLWIGPNLIIAGLWDPAVGNAEIRAIDAGARTSKTIFSAPYSALAWNADTGQLAIAGTPALQLAQAAGQGTLAPGLFTWAPAAAQPTKIDDHAAEALAWTPEGSALAYSAGGRSPGVWVWSIGAEGDIKQIAGASAQRLSWSADGQQLAADRSIYSRTGKLLAEAPPQPGAPIGWIAQGFVYTVLSGGDNYDLMLWDGASAQLIAANVIQAGLVGGVPASK